MESFEPRLLLSASLTYRPQKPDGSLDTPVTFQTQGQVGDFVAKVMIGSFRMLTGLSQFEGDSRHK